MSDLNSLLVALGFAEDIAARERLQAAMDEAGTSEGAPHSVRGVFVKGNITVYVEQNAGNEDLGGLSAVVTYPATAVIESPKGRVAFSPSDLGLAEHLVAELG